MDSDMPNRLELSGRVAGRIAPGREVTVQGSCVGVDCKMCFEACAITLTEIDMEVQASEVEVLEVCVHDPVISVMNAR